VGARDGEGGALTRSRHHWLEARNAGGLLEAAASGPQNHSRSTLNQQGLSCSITIEAPWPRKLVRVIIITFYLFMSTYKLIIGSFISSGLPQVLLLRYGINRRETNRSNTQSKQDSNLIFTMSRALDHRIRFSVSSLLAYP
jgi:hypothetical protein